MAKNNNTKAAATRKFNRMMESNDIWIDRLFEVYECSDCGHPKDWDGNCHQPYCDQFTESNESFSEIVKRRQMEATELENKMDTLSDSMAELIEQEITPNTTKLVNFLSEVLTGMDAEYSEEFQ